MTDQPNEDRRLTWGLIVEVLDVLERHGWRKGDDQHAGRAIGLLLEVARVYSGEADEPAARITSPSVPGGWDLVQIQALMDAIRWCRAQEGDWPPQQIGMYRAFARSAFGIELGA